MKKTLLAVSASLAFGSMYGHATNDGVLDTLSSTGDLDITVEVPNLVQISDLDDIDLGTYAGAAMTGEDQVCVYRNGTGNYEITFTAGSNTGAADAAAGTTAYELESAAGETIPYTVDFEDSAAGAYADTSLAINTALTGQSGHASDVTCGGGNNAKVQVNVAKTDLEAVPAGNYTGTLYMTVAPE